MWLCCQQKCNIFQLLLGSKAFLLFTGKKKTNTEEMLVEDCKMKVNLFLPYSKSGWGFAHTEQVSCLSAPSDTLPCHRGVIWLGPGVRQGAGTSAEPQHAEPRGRLSARGGLAEGGGISPVPGERSAHCSSA